ncbi:hypothetical protein, partial [Escherichia coli]|uniref:hypothetical protein n=1 Tax=Escherichia coli TaxID=562 RepID=UPI001BE4C118
ASIRVNFFILRSSFETGPPLRPETGYAQRLSHACPDPCVFVSQAVARPAVPFIFGWARSRCDDPSAGRID